MNVVPACSRCSLRKIKCDRKAPKCSFCEKARSACVITDRSRAQTYTRQYVQELLEEIERLQALKTSDDAVGEGNLIDNVQPSPLFEAEDTPTDRDQNAPGQRYHAGSASGIGFLRYVFGMSDWRAHQFQLHCASADGLPLLKRPSSLHEWPSFETAKLLVNTYLNHSHLHHPFLFPGQLLQTLDRTYQIERYKASPQDSYTLFMVFAVAAVRTHRNGLSTCHPHGYYLAAQRFLDKVPVLGSVEAIQNLLLIARFGMYHDIGTSLWELSHICIRQCVQLNLHRSVLTGDNLVARQLQCCVFWDCYLNERYISDTLGRPYAIGDQAIETPLPLRISYDCLGDPRVACPFAGQNEKYEQLTENDMSVFLFAIGLRQIQSANRTAFSELHDSVKDFTIRPPISRTPGLIMHKVEECLVQLNQWRMQAPVFLNPTSTYHIPDWYSFLVAKEKLNVTRGALTFLLQLNVHPPKQLLDHCGNFAIEVITLYRNLSDQRNVLPTRNYFQSLFVSGLTLMFCRSYRMQGLSMDQRKSQKSEPEVAAAIHSCAYILLRLSRDMPDSQLYYVIFKALSRKLASDDPNNMQSQQSSDDEEHAAGSSYATAVNQPSPTRDTNPTQPVSTSLEDDLRIDNHMLFADIDTAVEHDWDWEIFLSEENMQRMVADVGSYAWDQSASIYMP